MSMTTDFDAIAAIMNRSHLPVIQAEFDGSGDEGLVHIFAPGLDPNEERMVEAFLYEVLCERCGGWEINEGSCGELTLMLDGRLDITINWRLESYETEQRDVRL